MKFVDQSKYQNLKENSKTWREFSLWTICH